jgi:5-(carboxyamino)imidazole ribonucleotide synthase
MWLFAEDRPSANGGGPLRIGVMGGGQLGRMLALEGYRLGLRFRFLEPHPEAPVSELGEVVEADYDDIEALRPFADGLDVATYEFENVPVTTARALDARVPVLPPPGALQVAQDRVTEKQAFEALDIPTSVFLPIERREDMDTAVARLGLPVVLKTRRWGYDGKGQVVIRAHGDIDGAWERLGGRPLILERFVRFNRELSIIGVRARDGAKAFYPLVENEHRDGIIHLTIAPAPVVTETSQAKAEGYLTRLMDSLQYVGVLALELFQEGDELLANEMAPRVHNSGHWTLDGAECSQFENHLRALCGLPLGSTAPLGHAGMINLVGVVPPPARILAIPGARLHLYDKEPRPGRKLGHVNVVAADPATVREALERVEAEVNAARAGRPL